MDFHKELREHLRDIHKMAMILDTIAQECPDDTAKAYVILAKARLLELNKEQGEYDEK